VTDGARYLVVTVCAVPRLHAHSRPRHFDNGSTLKPGSPLQRVHRYQSTVLPFHPPGRNADPHPHMDRPPGSRVNRPSTPCRSPGASHMPSAPFRIFPPTSIAGLKVRKRGVAQSRYARFATNGSGPGVPSGRQKCPMKILRMPFSFHTHVARSSGRPSSRCLLNLQPELLD
jgi:hypothetical protein